MTTPLGALLAAGLAIIDKVIPDPQAKAAAQLEMVRMEQAGAFKQIDTDLALALGQMEVNKVEAATDNFRGGWRPASGWVCVTGMAYTYVVGPFLGWVSMVQGWPVPPAIDTFDLMIMLGGLLGLGGMRSFERIKGKA